MVSRGFATARISGIGAAIRRRRRDPGPPRSGFGPPGARRSTLGARTRERLHELGKALADLKVRYSEVVVHELDRFARAQRIALKEGGVLRQAAPGAPRPAGGALLDALVKVRDFDAQGLGDLVQVAGADPVGAVLVFLDLLEGDADRLSQLRLAEPQAHPSRPDPRADVPVDGIGSAFRISFFHEYFAFSVDVMAAVGLASAARAASAAPRLLAESKLPDLSSS